MADMEHMRIGNAELAVFSLPAEPAVWPSTLSPSERAVVRGLLRNRSNREIARARGVSEATVHSQIRQVLAKMEVGSASELVSRLARVASAGTDSRRSTTA
jgi:DNA-binding NarL/FixJ family response regulator